MQIGRHFADWTIMVLACAIASTIGWMGFLLWAAMRLGRILVS
jgi:hypothetical protein